MNGSAQTNLLTERFQQALTGDTAEQRRFVDSMVQNQASMVSDLSEIQKKLADLVSKTNNSEASQIQRTRQQSSANFAQTSALISAPGNLWEDRDFWAIVDRESAVSVGTIVTLGSGRSLIPTKPRSTTLRDRAPFIGVVHEKQGYWSRIRTVGPTYVCLDTEQWQADYHWGTQDTLWLSDKTNGCASCRIPTTARNDIVLIGQRIGSIQNGVVEAFIRPAIYPATWWRVWEADANNYIDVEFIAIRGGLWRMVFVVNGTTAAIADDDYFVLRGSVWENEYTSDTQDTATYSRNGEIEFTSSSSLESGVSAITFQVPHQSSGTYTRVAELNKNGDLLCGALVEGGFPMNAGGSNDFTGARYLTNGGNLDLTIDLSRTLFRCERYSTGADPVNAYFEVNEIVEGGIA